LAVIDEFFGDALSAEAPMFDKDPISDNPRDDRDVDDTDFLSKEVGTADLVGVALEVFHPLVEGGYL